MADTDRSRGPCPCFSGRAYADCCEPVVTGTRPAATAEELMRGRYCAYAVGAIDFILSSTYPDRRAECDEKSIRSWSANSEWTGFEVLSKTAGLATDGEGTVEFVARYTEERIKKTLHETGSFKKSNGLWYYVDGTVHPPKPFVRGEEKINRNALCGCGSGKKYKKCCMDKDRAVAG